MSVSPCVDVGKPDPQGNGEGPLGSGWVTAVESQRSWDRLGEAADPGSWRPQAHGVRGGTLASWVLLPVSFPWLLGWRGEAQASCASALTKSLCPDAPQNLTISISGAGDPGRRDVPLGLGRGQVSASREPSAAAAVPGRPLGHGEATLLWTEPQLSRHQVQLEGISQNKHPDAAHRGRRGARAPGRPLKALCSSPASASRTQATPLTVPVFSQFYPILLNLPQRLVCLFPSVV